MADRGPGTARAGGHWQLNLRLHAPPWLPPAATASGVAIGLLASALILVGAGVPLSDLGRELAATLFGSPRALAAVLTQAAPLIVVGLAAALAFRASFWNIGLEGQIILGAIFATGVALADPGPEALRLPLMALAAAAGGALWMLGPALLKLRLGVSEIMSTLMLNYVAFNLLLWLLYGPWIDPGSGFPHSAPFDAAERLPKLGFGGVGWGLPLALALGAVSWWLMERSRPGYLLAFLHANPSMARSVGVPVAALALLAALGSGALAGLAGFTLVAGVEFRLTQAHQLGYMFSGILIAFLARNRPLAVVVVAFAVAVLMVLGQSLQVFYQIPLAVVTLIQAVIITCVAASEFAVRYRLDRVGRAPSGSPPTAPATAPAIAPAAAPGRVVGAG